MGSRHGCRDSLGPEDQHLKFQTGLTQYHCQPEMSSNIAGQYNQLSLSCYPYVQRRQFTVPTVSSAVDPLPGVVNHAPRYIPTVQALGQL